MAFQGGRPPFLSGAYPPGLQQQQYSQFGNMSQVRQNVRMPGLLPTPPGTALPNNNQSSNRSSSIVKPLVPDDKIEDSNKPKTTVFVGNISDRAPDTLVRGLLGRCGPVLSWKRVQGASGKLQAFGFCEYGDPDASLRAIRLLHELEIGDRKLVVKVDGKTRTLLDEYLQTRDGDQTSELDDSTVREDSDVRNQVRRLVQDYSMQLQRTSEEKAFHGQKQKNSQKDEKQKAKDKLDDMNLEEEKKDLINREIDRFRQSYKDQREALEQKETPEEKEKSRREREKERERDRQRRDQIKERERRDRDRERDRHRETERERVREERERDERERYERDRSRDYDRDYDRERGGGRAERSERGERDGDRDRLEEEEDYEKRKLERKLREKEEAYQERLRNWETRERKKQRDHEKMMEKEESERNEMDKEGKRLKEFLEDYEDERDDPKYYKGSALERRRKEREKEEDSDNRDRRREREEIEDIKRRLMEEGGEDLDAEIEKLEIEREKHKQPQLEKLLTPRALQIKQELQPTLKSTFEPADAPMPPENNQGPRTPASESSDDDDGGGGFDPLPDNSSQSSEDDSTAATAQQMGFGRIQPVETLSPVDEEFQHHRLARDNQSMERNSGGPDSPPTNSNDGGYQRPLVSAQVGSKRKKLKVGDVFNQEESSDSAGKKKRKLVPIEYSEEEMKAVGQSQLIANAAEEKRKTIKNLIEKIPTAKDELFGYKVDWAIVDESLMDRRIKPWINKKIVEYIGEEEPTLTEFICSKLLLHSNAESILNDITMVLDEEAEVFVVKMWRLLIYEVEAKKHGLVK
ncbi:RNA-binding protein 25 isoform X2 [Strongylocentrotus purpuratus]|uniref:RNA-binding protein 25 n=1 Tax=Strongylocentrotus purpuratus TaxID=7668 RepID=A0A7M7PRN1_STRPU|nr:RNA-binding protein 25 isoform X2 [Strongylocentrotus purpuratus]